MCNIALSQHAYTNIFISIKWNKHSIDSDSGGLTRIGGEGMNPSSERIIYDIMQLYGLNEHQKNNY